MVKDILEFVLTISLLKNITSINIKILDYFVKGALVKKYCILLYFILFLKTFIPSKLLI